MITREKIKSLQNKFFSNLLYGGIKKEEYKEIEGEILERDRNSLVMISICLMLMFAYAIILNTVLRNDISANTFCLIMMAAPLLVMDKPWRLFCYFVLILAVFVPIDFRSKAYYLAYTDKVNVLCSLFLGSVIHMSIIRTKTRVSGLDPRNL